MPHKISLCAVAFAVVLTATSASGDTLRAGGVGPSSAMLPVLFAAFDPNGKHKLEVIPALGSSGGLRAVADGMLDIAVAGRELKPHEKAQGLTQTIVIRTPFVLVTSRPNPAGLKSADVAGLYQSQKAAWPEGSPIRIILRPASDSDTPVLGSMFPNMPAALDQARKRAELPVAPTDQDNASMAEQTPSSFASSTLTQIQLERCKLHLIPIDGVAPSWDSLERGSYPFAKTFYFVLPAKKNPLAERFLDCLRSPQGQAALRETGNLPVATTVAPV
jgi:phosphate transport system substrate-binding protein